MDSSELLDVSVLGVTDQLEGQLHADELQARLEAALPH
jgi:hypothetical protein